MRMEGKGRRGGRAGEHLMPNTHPRASLTPAQLGPEWKRWLPPATPARQLAPLSMEADASDDECTPWPALEAAEDEEAAEPQAFIAAPAEILAEEELARAPCQLSRGPQRWLESDDAPACEDGVSIKLNGLSNSRQTVLARDWVHLGHSPPVREWTVYASAAKRDFGDIYFGYTESQCFSQKGRTFLVDVRGNARYGFHPLQLLYCERREEVERLGNTLFSGAFAGRKDDKLVVALDLWQQIMTVRNTRTGDSLKQHLPTNPPVRCARLCASMHSAGDVLVIESVR
jgi:hypothetical protein